MTRNKQSPSRDSSKTNNGTYYFTAILVALLGLSFILLARYLPLSTSCNSERHYNSTPFASIRRSSEGDYIFRIAVITDLDQDSKHPTKKNTWISYFKTGELIVSKDYRHADVHWNDEKETIILSSQISAGGRAMELSDLAVFDGHLLTIDDRTGIIYRLDNNFKETIPWVFVGDGAGNATKGLKGEWITIKDQHLFVGGLGKEWTTTEGVFVNHHPMYVKRIGKNGEIEHINWVENYKKLRRAVGIEWPGYMIHETCQWSEIHNKWFFMPRRASLEPYTEATDEYAGTDLLLIADETFDHIEVKHVGKKGTGYRGFSAFHFVPGSSDNLIAALKSEEKDGIPVGTYITVFRLSDGHALMDEVPLKGAFKFEGLAFI